MKTAYRIFFLFLCWGLTQNLVAQPARQGPEEKLFQHPPPSARPWVFWYWMHGAVSRTGITADLEAMKAAGIGGAYLMPIKDTTAKIPFSPVARQLTPAWWALVKHAFLEARRLKLELGLHFSDGFALAGGPWITPALSMQKLVWTKTYLRDGSAEQIIPEQPESFKGFYKDVAVFAYPANCTNPFSDITLLPAVSSSDGSKPFFLSFTGEEDHTFKSDSACWIQYRYPAPFTCRAVTVKTAGNNYQALRLEVQASEDGSHFRTVARLEAPRHGWQDWDQPYTWSVPATTARWFRFIYNKEGTEPGAEDLDAAKWKPALKIKGLYLSDEPVIHQYQAKNGSVWRVAANTHSANLKEEEAVPLKSIINLTGKMKADGSLDWQAPAGNWIIVRIGHTSQGHTNYTGGGGLGLECDKFNPAAVKLQYKNWFGKFYEKTGPALARQVLKVLHVDSWEAGSQNWTADFPAEFKKRRGYDLLPYLLTMAGVPVENASVSEKVLHDVRQTITDLVQDVFYTIIRKEADAKGLITSAEAIAPTMLSDGLLHYKLTDRPMGEFWLKSPTHDKPNDMLDAISGARIYGKKIVQAESFTTLRMDWSEHPGNLKALGDRQLALGVNKLVFHVFTQNPWMNKKPGMTLDAIGLYFQRDQTWFRQARAWMDYLSRCQSLLQQGKPVVDIAVFTGEELPRRALLPDRLVHVLPGLIGNERIKAEKFRLENKGQPQKEQPDGVIHSANMTDPANWTDPLNGYAYDSFNPDVLLQMKVQEGKLVTAAGMRYSLLVFPGKHPLHPNAAGISLPVARKILELLQAGARIIMEEIPSVPLSMGDGEEALQKIGEQLRQMEKAGRLITGPWQSADLSALNITRDMEVIRGHKQLAWTHRELPGTDIYFISNQSGRELEAELSFRISDSKPTVLDPVTGRQMPLYNLQQAGGRTRVSFLMAKDQSLFLVFRQGNTASVAPGILPMRPERILDCSKDWTLQFDPAYGGPVPPVPFTQLRSWSEEQDPAVRYYSGSVMYRKEIMLDPDIPFTSAVLQLDSLFDIASVKVNGTDCGTIWTHPFSLDIRKALKPGKNKLELMVTNTWYNRLAGDEQLPPEKRITWTTAPVRHAHKPLLPAGITGNVKIILQ